MGPAAESCGRIRLPHLKELFKSTVLLKIGDGFLKSIFLRYVFYSNA